VGTELSTYSDCLTSARIQLGIASPRREQSSEDVTFRCAVSRVD
jgi:hypothetical protein